MTQSQRTAAQAFEAQRGTPVFGPFVPLLRSPELMPRLAAVGQHCRYANALGSRLAEFIVLLVSRRFSADLEWDIHAPIAERAGVAAATIADLKSGRRPQAMAADEALVYDTVEELWRHHGLSDASYAAVVAAFGEAGVIDLTATVGYYATLALVLNVARTPSPSGKTLPRLP